MKYSAEHCAGNFSIRNLLERWGKGAEVIKICLPKGQGKRRREQERVDEGMMTLASPPQILLHREIIRKEGGAERQE